MPTLPVNENTFSRAFLDGAGNITVGAPGWRPIFDANGKVAALPDDIVGAQVSLKANRAFRFGAADGLQLSLGGGVSGESKVRVLRSAPSDVDELKGISLGAPKQGEAYLWLRLGVKADGSAAANMPSGTAALAVTAKGGASAFYDRLKIYSDRSSARKAVLDLLQGIQLPQQIDSVAEIPAANEVLITRYAGYLNLAADLTWGWKAHGSRSSKISGLNLDFSYKLQLAASVGASFSLAGAFDVEARNVPTRSKWVRFVVRKSRESSLGFTANVGLDATLDLSGLPATADEFLSQLIGSNAEAVLNRFRQLRDVTNVKKLRAIVNDRLTLALVDDLAMKWVGKALDNTNVKEVLSRLQQVVETYDGLDDRVVQYYQDLLDKLGTAVPSVAAAKRVLARLAEVDNPKALDKLVRDAIKNPIAEQAYGLVKRFWGGRLHDLIQDQKELKQVGTFARRANKLLSGGADSDIRGFIQKVKAASRLEPLFAQLRQYDTPAELRAKADERLKGLVENIVGKAFNKITNSDLGKKLNKLNKALNQIEDFKNKKYQELLGQVSNRSFKASVAFAYNRAKKGDALLDVEVNLARAEGVELARLASAGDFAKLLRRYDSSLVRVKNGAFHTELRKSTELTVNLFGRGYSRLVDIVSNTEHAVTESSGGLLHVFTTQAEIKDQIKRSKKGVAQETIASSFLFRALTEKLQKSGDPSAVDARNEHFLADTLRGLSVDYTHDVEDLKTRPAKLTEYLALAAHLGLIASSKSFVGDLEARYPRGLGKVSVSYSVRYDDDVVRWAFKPTGREIEALARRVSRDFISARFTGMKKTAWMARVGFAYRDAIAYDRRIEANLGAGPVTVILPAWFTGDGAIDVTLDGKAAREPLRTLYLAEDRLVKSLRNLDETLDPLLSDAPAVSVPVDKIEEASRKFVSAAPTLQQYRANSFFVVFDQLVRAASGGVKGGRSSLILEITPPPLEGERAKTFTEILGAPRKEDARANGA